MESGLQKSVKVDNVSSAMLCTYFIPLKSISIRARKLLLPACSDTEKTAQFLLIPNGQSPFYLRQLWYSARPNIF